MQERIVREPERRLITGISKSSWNRFEKQGGVPDKILLAGRLVGWRYSDLISWIESRTVKPKKPEAG